jgi:hypothetical protein
MRTTLNSTANRATINQEKARQSKDETQKSQLKTKKVLQI